MKKQFFTLSVFSMLFFAFACTKDAPEIQVLRSDFAESELGIIPLPRHTNVYVGALTLPAEVQIFTEAAEVSTIALLGALLETQGIKSAESATVNVQLNGNAAIDSLGTEGYILKINKASIDILANSDAGLFYGIQTFAQLLPVKGQAPVLPYLEIVDWPSLSWRGLHLDVCRHFFPVAFVKKYIDQMSKYKLNTFHWHLTEDQGWRIEIKKYPKLTEIASTRKETILEKNFDPYVGDGIPYSGFYTQEEIREIVAYAEERHVTIVPEIEMPGHSVAALTAYPEYSCMGGPFEVRTLWGVSLDTYCTTDETFQFLTDILDEVMELFPSKYIHIGGDEAPKTRWKACEKCQSRMKEQGLQTEEELQSYFIKRIEQHLISKGRSLIGWDEILEGGLAPEATVMSWRGETGGFEASKQGHDVVMTPGFAMYFDHYQGDPEQEPLAICCYTPLEKVYNYMPVSDRLEEAQRKHIIGVQANIWTEYIPTSDQVEYMAYPRALALSEIAWTPNDKKDWNSFLQRLGNQFPRLEQAAINYRIPEPFGLEDKLLGNVDSYEIQLNNLVPDSKVYYTLDGSNPDKTSLEYSGPITLDFKTASSYTVKAFTQTASGRPSIKSIATYKKVAAGELDEELTQGVFLRITDGKFTNLDELEKVTDFQNEFQQSHFRIPGVIGWYSSFGLVYEGFIEIEEANTFYFDQTVVGGASRLYINNEVILENGGTAKVDLDAGLIPVRILYFNTDSNHQLDLKYGLTDKDLKSIPNTRMWH
ncbi:MAG: family 20 glycosylhydrolase [Saprospiraceae bacterium]|nr:family 20 glycosylhydrolase [Saprospiraceae bacterium]